MIEAFEKATMTDLDELEQLYDSICDYLDDHTNYPGWRKGLYPDRETARTGIEDQSLYVARTGGRIAGTAILRHEAEPAYEKVDWHADFDYSEIFVIYTLAVHPDFLRQDMGSRMMELIMEYSKNCGMKAIRLDVYKKNVPAMKLYEKFGFEHMDTVDLGLGCYGLDLFELYQKIL